MSPGGYLHEVALFELPSPLFGARLMDHVGSERFAWLQGDAVVGVVLTSDALDVAQLLRTVQNWLASQGLESIRFELDRLTYYLDSSPLPLLAG